MPSHRARRARVLPVCAGAVATTAVATALFAQAQATPAGKAFALTEIGRLGGLGAEIVAYDAVTSGRGSPTRPRRRCPSSTSPTRPRRSCSGPCR